MSLPNRIEAYDDCLDHFQSALDDSRGYRIKFATHGEANIFQLRLHQARALQRDINKRIYEPSHPLWGSSEFDKLIVRIPREDTEGGWWIYIERPQANILVAEPLSEVE